MPTISPRDKTKLMENMKGDHQIAHGPRLNPKDLWLTRLMGGLTRGLVFMPMSTWWASPVAQPIGPTNCLVQ